MAVISIIIPTYNGAAKLPMTLESLSRQSEPDFELILVIDGSTDHTSQVAEGYRHIFRNMIAHHQKNGGRSRARNVGAALATSERLLFLDDDIIAQKDLVLNHLRLSSQDPDCIYFGAAYLQVAGFSDAFSKFRARIETGWKPPISEEVIGYHNFKFTSQNFSIQKAIFEDIGGFDERLTDSEDFDLALRLLRANNKIKINADLSAGHFDQKTLKQYVERQKKYYKSKLDLLSLRPEYAEMVPNHFAFRKITKSKKNIARYLYPENLVSNWWEAVEKGFPLVVPDFITRFHIWQQVFISGK